MTRGAAASPRDRAVLVLLARAPSAPGKTRLTVGLSDEQARALREALLLDTLDRARSVGIPVVTAFTPDNARDEMSHLVDGVPLICQRGSNLGERMRHAMHDAFEGGVQMVALIGSDLPTLPPEHVIDALTMLERDADLVLGPTEDGGFYLIAARNDLPPIFRAVDWSTAAVLQRVAQSGADAGLTVGFAREWWDVDTSRDLQRLMNEANPDTAVRTRACLRSLASS